MKALFSHFGKRGSTLRTSAKRRLPGQRSGIVRLATWSIAGTVCVVAMPILGWPVLDLYIWPKAMKRSMTTKKKMSCPSELNVSPASMELRYYLDDAQKEGGIVLLTGSDATALARKFASETTPCAYLDLRTLFDTNAYESLCFQHIGWPGDVLNVFMKLVIFGTSLVSGTIGRPDAQLPFTRNCFNNLRRTFRELRLNNETEGRFLIIDNFGTAVKTTCRLTGETKEKYQYAIHSYVGMLSSFASDNLCGVALVWKNFDSERLDFEEDEYWQSDLADYVDSVSVEKLTPFRKNM